MASLLRKKEFMTVITPIPSFIPRQLAIDILHSHDEVITLNPLVLEFHTIKAPSNAASDEYFSTWYEITERIQYIPGFGKMGSGKISFNGCFHNMPWGLQTHIYAPMSTDMRYKYRIGGNQPGVEPPEPLEMGLEALGAKPNTLYLREDVEFKCSIGLVGFVKAQVKAASKLMVERIIKKAELIDAGVLHAMLDNGTLRTVNPADRSGSGRQPQSPASTPSPVPRTDKRASSSSAEHKTTIGSPSLPYQVPRPQSISSPYYPRPGSSGVNPSYQNPATPGQPYPPYPAYGAHLPQAPPYGARLSFGGYPGAPGQQSMNPAMYVPYAQPQHSELQGSYPMGPPQAPGYGVGMPGTVEMPGDYYYPQQQQQQQQQQQPSQSAASAASAPQSRGESDVPPSQWSTPAAHSQYGLQPNQSPNLHASSNSRPASSGSDNSTGAAGGGFRSPPLEHKGFASELSTHRETPEEHRQEALKRLDPHSGPPAPSQYIQSGYGR